MHYELVSQSGRGVLTPQLVSIDRIDQVPENATRPAVESSLESPLQRVDVARLISSAAGASGVVDLRGHVIDLRDQQLSTPGGVTRIVGGVWLIGGTASRSGIVSSGRPASAGALTIDGAVFSVGEVHSSQEGVIYQTSSGGSLRVVNCIFGGEILNRDRLPVRPTDLAQGGLWRAISVRATSGSGGGLEMRRCHINTGITEQQSNGIPAVSCIGSTASAQRAFYQSNKRPADLRGVIESVEITNCTIIGGYYGVGLNGALKANISGNVIVGCVRGISVQDSSENVRIESNVISDYYSTGIHVAYGSEATVIANSLSSARCIGQGHIVAYCSSELNAVANDVRGDGSRPSYGIYLGNGTNGTVSRNNVRASVMHAGIGIEQSWSGSTAPQSYATRYSADAVLGVADAVTVSLDRNSVDVSSEVQYYVSESNGVLNLKTDRPIVRALSADVVWGDTVGNGAITPPSEK